MDIDAKLILDTLKDLEKPKDINTLPVLPVKEMVVFPTTVVPILVGRSSSLKAIAEAMSRDKLLILVPQKQYTDDFETPDLQDLHKIGTLVSVSQIVRLPGSLIKLLVQGTEFVTVNKFTLNDGIISAKFKVSEIEHIDETELKFQALVKRTVSLFESYIKVNEEIPSEIINTIHQISDPLRKFYLMASNTDTSFENKIELLQQTNITDMLLKLSSILNYETEILKFKIQIDNDVNDKVAQIQKKYLIREQIRILREELGEAEVEEENVEEVETLKKKILDAKMSQQAEEKALDVLTKLKRIPSISPDYAVERNYIDLLLQLPWNNLSEDNLDINSVKTILDEDHYDLEKPKERILDFIAILNLTKDIKRQIICFVGPPGTGKTSLAKSIARALGRKFVRVALGGLKDEAEIRGHRRTYIGALPGKMINAVKKAGTNNPVILLDEIDKLSYSYQGDPASALLEVLDPEQNSTFTDHYLEVEWDLSKVLFITTANVYYDIPLPLLDRMEIIEVSSYLDFQKVEIAKKHIIPKLQNEFGLLNAQIEFEDESILKIIRSYTREPGVRELERQISTIFRKVARDFLSELNAKKDKKKKQDNDLQKQLSNFKIKVTPEKVLEYLKVEKFKDKIEEIKNQIGLVNGLAWTSVGGEILPVEVTIMSGQERLTLTGKLGEVMRESAVAGLSHIRSNAVKYGIKPEFFKGKEIHIHIPEGAIPKDGPSAGVTMAIAILSAITQSFVRGDIAMTGEITLRGNVLPIGGLREKLLAAKKAKMKTVLIPKENESDLVELPDFIKEGLEIIPISLFSEAVELAFLKKPKKIML